MAGLAVTSFFKDNVAARITRPSRRVGSPEIISPNSVVIGVAHRIILIIIAFYFSL